MINGGIFGPKLSGKTTLAKALSAEYWRKAQMRTLCLDLNGDVWGQHAFATPDEDFFWGKVWQCRRNLIIVDEAAATIRRDRALLPVFTRMRHCEHKLIVIGHSGMDLLPTMRQQLDTIYLFRQPESAAKVWAENFAEDQLLQCTQLRQFEFLFHVMYGETRKCRLQLGASLP